MLMRVLSLFPLKFGLTKHSVFFLNVHGKARCEAILRSHPDNRLAAELHLACIQGEEELKDKQLKKSILEGTVGVAAIGLASIAGMMLLGGGRRK